MENSRNEKDEPQSCEERKEKQILFNKTLNILLSTNSGRA